MARGGVFLLALLLLVPSANYQLFDGLPLDGRQEFVGLALLVPLLVSRGLRRFYRRWVARWPRGLRSGLLGAGILALAAKVALIASGTHVGFLACYRTPIALPAITPCERSFENAFFRFAATRIDRTVSFRENDWDLGFLNSLRLLDDRAPREGRIPGRVPLDVTWQGTVGWTRPWTARITYVGEVRLTSEPLGPGPPVTGITLESHYGTPITALVPIPAGPRMLRLQYHFDDGSRFDGPGPVGPWATLRLERGRGPEGREPGKAVRTIGPALIWRTLAGSADAVVGALAGSLLLFYSTLLRRDLWLLALAALAVPVVDRLPLARLGLPTSLGLCLLLAVVALTVLSGPWRRRLVGAYLATLYLALFTTWQTFPRLSIVTLRDLREDPIGYESHARSILETWSLEGGESVYFFQPGFRYVRFLERLLLGDGDGLLSIAALTALYWGLYWAFARLWPRPRPPAARAVVFVSVMVLVLALASSAPILWFVQLSLSEYPTWIALALAFPMLLVSRSARAWLLGSALTGLSCPIRLNQIPALLALVAISARRVRARVAVVAAVLLLGILALPAAHNLYYGRRVVWTTDSSAIASNYVLRPGDLLKLTTDPRVQRRLHSQLDYILYTHTLRSRFWAAAEVVSWVAIRGIQILWLLVGIVTLCRGTAPRITKVLLGLPLSYLVVHVFYAVDSHYPRHIIAGYLAMGLVTLNALGRGWTRQT